VKNRQATGFTLAVAVTQLLIYNGMGGTHGGPGEKIAHYFEFTSRRYQKKSRSRGLRLRCFVEGFLWRVTELASENRVRNLSYPLVRTNIAMV
jgi:hypothetical protein